MKNSFFYIIVLSFIWMQSTFHAFSQDINQVKDSLIHALGKTEDSRARLEILTNLSDLASGQKDFIYSRMLWKEAIAAGDNDAASAAIVKIIVNKLDKDEVDSMFYYTGQAREKLKYPAKQAIPTYYEMIYEARKLQGSDDAECDRIVKETSRILKDKNATIDEYEKMKNIYIIICSINRVMSLRGNADEFLKQMEHYSKQMLEIAKTIPMGIGRNLYMQQALMICCNSYKQDTPEYVNYTLQQLDVYESFLKLPAIQKRPYYSQRSRIRIYGALASASTLSQKERDFYFNKFKEILRKYPSQAPSPPAPYYMALIGYKYYEIKKDNVHALEQLDSLLKYNTYPLDAIKHMKNKAEILSETGNYKDAYVQFTKATQLSDSLNAVESKSKYQELQTLYDVNATKLKNAELQHHNHLITMGACTVFLLLMSGWGGYNYYIRRKIQKLNTKIRESETVKNAFLHSMCHEVRTPLNKIVGFSSMLLIPEMEEEKESMGKEIEQQSHLLTKMLGDILEVSELDSSEDVLPTEHIDIHAVCRQEIQKFQWQHEDREWVLDAAHTDEQWLINRNYFNQLIDNLLSNAGKFSEPGSCTTLSYQIDHEKKLLKVSVTDTGIGIPEDKHKWIFERFTKIDDFKQGAGLGLYVCQLIVKRMNGIIYIDRTYKQGAKVIFEIPVNK